MKCARWLQNHGEFATLSFWCVRSDWTSQNVRTVPFVVQSHCCRLVGLIPWEMLRFPESHNPQIVLAEAGSEQIATPVRLRFGVVSYSVSHRMQDWIQRNNQQIVLSCWGGGSLYQWARGLEDAPSNLKVAAGAWEKRAIDEIRVQWARFLVGFVLIGHNKVFETRLAFPFPTDWSRFTSIAYICRNPCFQSNSCLWNTNETLRSFVFCSRNQIILPERDKEIANFQLELTLTSEKTYWEKK